MADPIGAVSLAIDLCDRLLDYYKKYKGYNEDISSTYSEISGLRQSCELLEKTLQDVSLAKDQVDAVNDRLADLRRGVEQLEEKVRKPRDNEDPVGFKQKLKAGSQRVLYPFKKDTLDELKTTVNNMKQSLMFAMEVLQLDVNVKTYSATTRVEGQMTNVTTAMTDLQIDTVRTFTGVQHLLDEKEATTVREALDWLSAPDPYENHNHARKRYEKGTGLWFLASVQYKDWIRRKGSRLWLHGKAGCCKTVLCSTIIDNILKLEETEPGCRLAFFYFTFSDTRKQHYRDMLLSIVSQLSRSRPLTPRLHEAYSNKRTPSDDLLEDMVVILANDCPCTYVVVDALDESPDRLDGRQEVVEGLERISARASKLCILITSRPEDDIKEFMSGWPAQIVSISNTSVNEDIRLYVEKKLETIPKLRKHLLPEVKREITEFLAGKADGMFRWAYCQMAELTTLKVFTLKYVKEKLASLPKTLDETYERILLAIDESDRARAQKALVWLAFAERPLTLRELEEACITRTEFVPDTDLEEADPVGSMAKILSSLVTVVEEEVYEDEESDESDEESDDSDEESDGSDEDELSHQDMDEGGHISEEYGKEEAYAGDDEPSNSDVGGETQLDPDSATESLEAQVLFEYSGRSVIRFAHFSVKEYLLSGIKRIGSSNASNSSLDVDECQSALANSCMSYLRHVSSKMSEKDREISRQAGLIVC